MMVGMIDAISSSYRCGFHSPVAPPLLPGGCHTSYYYTLILAIYDCLYCHFSLGKSLEISTLSCFAHDIRADCRIKWLSMLTDEMTADERSQCIISVDSSRKHAIYRVSGTRAFAARRRVNDVTSIAPSLSCALSRPFRRRRRGEHKMRQRPHQLGLTTIGAAISRR